jgi:hypothetical protein
VKRSALQSTLREMRSLIADHRTWAALVVLGLVVGVVGPLGTFALPPLARLAYWLGVVVVTAAIGTLTATLAGHLIGPRLPRLLRAFVAGAVAGLPVALVVIAINTLAFGVRAQSIDMASLVLYCMLIAASVTVLGSIFARRPAAPGDAPSAPALLGRLPLPQRGRLLHLAVADHYVEVTTDRGRALLLMRLSDAIRETVPVAGLQVHRSHWVALAAVRSAARQAGKPVLELENGVTVPVSRSYLAAARAAGLLV